MGKINGELGALFHNQYAKVVGAMPRYSIDKASGYLTQRTTLHVSEGENPVHTWSDGHQYRRESPGKWVRVNDNSADHPHHNGLEQAHQKHEDAFPHYAELKRLGYEKTPYDAAATNAHSKSIDAINSGDEESFRQAGAAHFVAAGHAENSEDKEAHEGWAKEHAAKIRGMRGSTAGKTKAPNLATRHFDFAYDHRKKAEKVRNVGDKLSERNYHEMANVAHNASGRAYDSGDIQEHRRAISAHLNVADNAPNQSIRENHLRWANEHTDAVKQKTGSAPEGPKHGTEWPPKPARRESEEYSDTPLGEEYGGE
jgi:hypothetical protein